MTIKYTIHLVFVLVSTLTGYLILPVLMGWELRYWGAITGFFIGGGVAVCGHFLQHHAERPFFWGGLGILSGLMTGGILTLFIRPLFEENFAGFWLFSVILFLAFPYLGMILSLRIHRDPTVLLPGTVFPNGEATLKILDTSVIIDGRIADLCETGFLEGAYIVPQFILHELQHIADSSDPLKRVRGRRGLDVLQRLQKMPGLNIRITDQDFPSIREVDSKIVALGKRLSAKVVTNDFNLNKVAELQGVHVLNINQLCNALRLVVLPGESMRVFIVKEGREVGQGVGYLDDGTMIVVDDARRWIGKSIDVVVTSVLQTSAGRMIFTKIREDPEREGARGVVRSV